MILLGCRPEGRHTEQHDVFFGIADSMEELVPAMNLFWPEAKGKLHVDAWREVRRVGGYPIEAVLATDAPPDNGFALFFINLGGYKPGEFEEFHYKMLVAAADKGEAVRQAKGTAFFQHTGFKGATAHVDDKWGVDVDDVYDIRDILPAEMKRRYRVMIRPAAEEGLEDEMHLGYLKLEKLVNGSCE